ncbi:MAG: hypothetical protein M1836_000134 [Candelina mexicana]|nr:MAG: hypothetical protein M1836_000134 [Candelina mexicana]
MNTVPSELLDAIITHLSKSSIASLRLVCRGFSAFGTSILFQTVHVFLLKKSFENLAAISRHEALRKQVGRLVFYAPFLEEHRASHGPYLKAITFAGGLSSYGIPTVLDNPTINRGLVAYQKYYNEQAMLQGNGEAFAWLATAMGRFEKLEDVKVGYLKDCLGPAWQRDLNDYPVLLRQIAVETLMPAQEWYWECPPPDHLMTLLRAISVSNSKIEEFRFMDPGEHSTMFFGTTQSSNDRLRCGDMEHLEKAFAHLKHLRIKLRPTSPTWKLALASDKFATFLAACPLLERLSFRMPTDNIDGYTPFRRLVFPRLGKLKIGDQNIVAQELAIFFARQSSLRVLALSNMHLRSGDWGSVFESLRDKGTISALRLEHLSQLDGDQEDSWEEVLSEENSEVNQLILEYVTRKTKTLKIPIPEKDEEVGLIGNIMMEID